MPKACASQLCRADVCDSFTIRKQYQKAGCCSCFGALSDYIEVPDARLRRRFYDRSIPRTPVLICKLVNMFRRRTNPFGRMHCNLYSVLSVLACESTDCRRYFGVAFSGNYVQKHGTHGTGIWPSISTIFALSNACDI